MIALPSRTLTPPSRHAELENTFKKSKYISQMWIYGNSFHTTLVAVIVPEHDTIMAWCQHNGVSGDFSEAVKDKKVCVRVGAGAMPRRAVLCFFHTLALSALSLTLVRPCPSGLHAH